MNPYVSVSQDQHVQGWAKAAAAAGLALVCLASAFHVRPSILGAGLAAISLLYLCRKAIFSWLGALLALVLVIMWLPAGVYALPGLSRGLEPWGLLLLAVLGALFMALMAVPGFHQSRMVFSGPILLFTAALVLSVGVNIGPLALQGLSRGAILGLAGYALTFAVFFAVRLLLRTERMLAWLIFTLALSSALVGLAAGFERFTHFNIFFNLSNILPLERIGSVGELTRGGGARSFGSAEHPIALGVVLALALPLAVHQSIHAPWPRRSTARRLFWVFASLLILVGMISTVSRTSIIVLAVLLVVALMLRPSLLLPLAVVGLPTGLAASLVAPAAVLNMLNSFLDPEELVNSQYSNPGWTGSGRLADIGPSLTQAGQSLWFGTGVGSRVVSGPDTNALILDNQLLGILLMHGVFGLAAALAIFLLPAFRMIRFAKQPGIAARHSDLAVAIACVSLGYPVALFFFDGFSFEQTLLFVLILLAAASFLVTRIGPACAAGRKAPPAGHQLHFTAPATKILT